MQSFPHSAGGPSISFTSGTSFSVDKQYPSILATFQSGIADVTAKYEDVKKANDLLRSRFDTLQKNHAELIKIKDEYKMENQKLRMDNEGLKSANDNLFSEVIQEKNEIILKLNADLHGLTSKLQSAEQREK